MGSWEQLLWFINQFGLLGVFIVSFLGNTIPYSTIPYLVFIVIYAGVLHDPYMHLLITLSGGLGAALGKVIVYFFGYGVRTVLPENIRRNIDLFAKLFKKSTFIAVLVFAASPLPDDIIYVPLGAMKYDLKKYFTALLTGKIIITGMAVFFGSSFTGLLREAAKIPDYISIPALLLITFYLLYLVAEIDWMKAAEIASKEGLFSMAKYIIYIALLKTIEIPVKIYRFIVKK